MTDANLDAETNRINLSWLLKLRWGAIAGQIVTILVVHYVLGIALPLTPLFAIVSAELVSNLGCALWVRRKPVVQEAWLTLLMAADVLLFTALLYETGGPFNPFNFLYLVHIALATGCRIEVRDTGIGMPAEVLARAGEPFFTTKEPGQGMGLGLFVARAVLERLGGKLELASTPGRGTTAVLTLPLTRDNSPHAGASQTVEP